MALRPNRVFEIDALTAKRIGAALLALLWKGSPQPMEYRADREGHAWLVTYIGPKQAQTSGSGWIVEPWQIALDAKNGAIIGGSTLGHARKGLRRRAYRAITANGVDVTSALWGTWPQILPRATPAKPDRSPTMLTVEETLGPKWTLGLSGRATSGGTTVRLRPADAAFLRALAAIRPPKGIVE